ncbi:MAG TPA: hypothetical protein VMW90_06525 [Acidobacteriota bacterium]|nr:hypothetical protein [Acidobacteriota bacterium]
MRKEMVVCEDGRRREARVYGTPRDEGDFGILEAGVRLKGKHVTGEAWYSRKTGIWYFFADPSGKNSALLPRRNKRPAEPTAPLHRSPTVRTS